MPETIKAYIQDLTDKDGNKVYPITKAEAVYMADNATTLDKQIENMQQSFQDGVDTLVNKLKSLGVTPEENSPAGIAAAIEVLAQNKFNDGVASIKIPATVSITTNGGAGQENYDIADGYYTEAIVDQSGAYNAGRLQGREDVKANPNGYDFTQRISTMRSEVQSTTKARLRSRDLSALVATGETTTAETAAQELQLPEAQVLQLPLRTASLQFL